MTRSASWVAYFYEFDLFQWSEERQMSFGNKVLGAMEDSTRVYKESTDKFLAVMIKISELG